MKIKYLIIGTIIITLLIPIFKGIIPSEILDILGLVPLICLGLIVYLLLRNLFRAIKGQIGKKDH